MVRITLNQAILFTWRQTKAKTMIEYIYIKLMLQKETTSVGLTAENCNYGSFDQIYLLSWKKITCVSTIKRIRWHSLIQQDDIWIWYIFFKVKILLLLFLLWWLVFNTFNIFLSGPTNPKASIWRHVLIITLN